MEMPRPSSLALIVIITLSNLENIQSLQQNSSCVYGNNCAAARGGDAGCPPGHYCPGGAGRAFPCPRGSYRSGTESLHCIDCPVNFFNHMLGQEACFPCGSEATQPEEGQATCICHGEGRIFQPSDGHCVCAPGYQLLAEDSGKCAPIIYDICRDGTIRNQDGQCLSQEQWSDYCSNQVCDRPDQYLGYEKVLGLCVCQTDDLDAICNAECRRRYKHVLQIACDEGSPRLQGRDSSGDQVVYTMQEVGETLGVARPMDKVLCDPHLESDHALYVVKVTGRGFWGIYNSDLQLIKDFFSGQETSANLSGQERIFQATEISGILNPTTCINMNEFIVFVASKHDYPIYDVNNLYNTNPGFDWGRFRTLEEEMRLSSRITFVLFQQFQDPGVYVIKLSSNYYKKMYIRVMPAGGQCYEDGPFFPTAPRHIIRNGIARMPAPLLYPDWPAIIGITVGLLIILITCVLLLVWFQDLGWTRESSGCPQFRKRQLQFNLDGYSSKGSTLTPLKKRHPRVRIRGHSDKTRDETVKQKCHKYLPCDEFWDYEQQVDLEGFSTHIFYEILLQQSLLVTGKLGHLKEEVKVFYEKLINEVSSLKEVCLKSLSITEAPKRILKAALESYARHKREAEAEITKRKRLAARYEEIVKKQMRISHQEMKCQEEHCVVFNTALRHSARLLEKLKDKNPGTAQCTKVLPQLEATCNRMYSAVMKESERLKAWGVFGEGTGASLVNTDRTRVLSREDLIAFDGSARGYEHVSSVHGLLSPAPHSVMLLASHYLSPVPNDHFIHSGTGKVLPIPGNVGYDPETSQLIPVVDSAGGEFGKTEAPILPYIPYPLCPNSGLPVKCDLPSIKNKELCGGLAVMVDPVSGMEVPVLAITIHPRTGQRLALGGTYLHPLTGILSPIQIGGPMMDAKKEKIVPILGVALDNTAGCDDLGKTLQELIRVPHTEHIYDQSAMPASASLGVLRQLGKFVPGVVVPVGGLVDASGSIAVIGDVFSEPLSGKSARIQGAALSQDKVVPHAGGYQAILESNLLVSQINIIDALKMHKDLISEDIALEADDLDQANKALNQAVENMKTALAVLKRHWMHKMVTIRTQHKLAGDIKCNGGDLGLIVYPKTELWIPAVLGMEVPDPGPSDLMVPVLGVEHDFSKGHLIPLAGTMEDSDGKGLIPITIGARTIDPVTGDIGPVTGAQIDPMSGLVMPVVQSLGSQEEPDFSLLEVLDKELSCRERFWQIQMNKEEELVKELNSTTIDVLDAAREEKSHKIKLTDRMLLLENICGSLEESSLGETQRRTNRSLNSLSLKISRLHLLDDGSEEKSQQMIFLLVVRKTIEMLRQFTEKMEQEAERLQKQMRECERGWEQKADGMRRTVLRHLVDQFEDHMMKRLSGVDAAYCRLEYVRESSKLRGLHAKGCLLRRAPHYTGTQAAHRDVTGTEVQCIGERLIPTLRHLIQIIEESKNGVLSSSEIQAPASGYSSRSTLKASAANSDNLQGSPKQDTPWLPARAPLYNSAGILYRHHGYLFRFLIEKQAGEMVHLEYLLVTEEMSRIWDYYESFRVTSRGKLREKLTKLVQSSRNKEESDVKHNNLEQMLGRSQSAHSEWERLLEELSDVHRTAQQSLNQKHHQEVKGLDLNPGRVIPGNHLSSDVKESIVQLALDMQTVYEPPYYEEAQMESNLTSEDKDLPQRLLRTVAARFVRQELLAQIRVYRILDAYNKLQIESCAGDVQKTLTMKLYQSCSGKAAAEETANAMEEQQVEKLLVFLRKSYREGKSQQPSLGEMKHQLKEEHFTLTEQLLQVRDKILLQELSISESRSNMKSIVCCVLAQRHLRQIVALLQDAFKIQKQSYEKLPQERRLYEDTMVGHWQEDVLNLFSNKPEAVLLLMKLNHVVKRMGLRERHLEEISGALREFCSEKIHILSCVEEAHYFAHELHTFREQKLKRLRDDLNHLCDVYRANEKSLEPDDDRREDKELLRSFQEQQAELEQAHRKQVSEERLNLQDQLERGELNGFMKQKLIKEHDETVAFLEKTVQRDLEKLSVKLEEETRKKKENPLHVTSSPGRLGPQDSAQDVTSLLAESIGLFQQIEQVTASRVTQLGPAPSSSMLPEFLTEGETGKILEPSPILALLREVDAQLRINAANAKILQDDNESHKDKGSSFRDLVDLQISAPGDLTPVPPEELTPRESAAFQYGGYILQLLRSHITTQDISLQVASCLPEVSHPGNAFRRSFLYQSSQSSLFVSRESLQSVGGFILLVIHCLSHIVTGDLGDDTNPTFLRTFFQALKICFTDDFFTRLQLSSVLRDRTFSSELSKGLESLDSLEETVPDHTSKLFIFPYNAAPGQPSCREALKNIQQISSEYNTEVLLRKKLAARKREFFTGIPRRVAGAPETAETSEVSITTEDLEEELDRLNTELIKTLREEMESRGQQDEKSAYSQMLSLEKDSLRMRIQCLEDKIIQQSDLV